MKRGIYPNAIARICGGREYPQVKGTVNFFKRSDGLVIEVEICGLPRTETGFFAFHIHDGDSCSGDGFSNTGGHFDPDKTAHPKHAEDLPPLLADHGSAYMKVFTDRICLENVMGRTVIVHSDPYDFHTQPSGNAGMKIACGVIQRV